jgi:hypothetical protein
VLRFLIERKEEFDTKGGSKQDKLQKWIEYMKLSGSPENWGEYCTETSKLENNESTA